MYTFENKPKATQQPTSEKSAIPGRAHFAQSTKSDANIQLLRTVDNQAAQRLFKNMMAGEGDSNTAETAHFDFDQIPIHPSSPAEIRPKLMVNKPGDIYEQEADRSAEQVMRMLEIPATRQSLTESKKQGLSRQSATNQPGTALVTPPIVHEVLNSPGQPLDAQTREFFEPRFGHDFSRVRVHADAKSDESARALNANAYTLGGHIAFAEGRYQPGTQSGRQLIAHELAHIFWQSPVHPLVQRQTSTSTQTSTQPPQTPIQQARALVSAFRSASGKPGVWPLLDRTTVADDMLNRIDNPESVNQQPTSLCGPASIAHLLLLNDPVRYVNVVQSLFEEGRATLNGFEIESSQPLRESSPPNMMAQVDWLLLGSLRDSANVLLSYTGPNLGFEWEEGLRGYTLPGAMSDWMKSVLECTEVEDLPNLGCVLGYEWFRENVVQASGSAFAIGKYVVWLINADLLKYEKSSSPWGRATSFATTASCQLSTPDHWVVLKSEITAEGNDIFSFSVYTWGGTVQLRVPLFALSTYLAGTLIGTPSPDFVIQLP
jgi:hypothetical protein